MLLERMVESDRIIMFRVAWIDDKGNSGKEDSVSK
jgi:glutamate dehydrogenase (NADP+)